MTRVALKGLLGRKVRAGLTALAFVQLTALVLNLLPVPGFDGWGILKPWVPGLRSVKDGGIAHLAPTLVFLAFIFIPATSGAFWRGVLELCRLLGLDAATALRVLRLFHF